MDIQSLGGGAAAIKAAVVTAVALPLLVGSVPAGHPPARTIKGREDPPAVTGAAGDRPFLISSVLTSSLIPGAAVPVNLTLTNPNSFGIDIEQLVVSIKRVNATDPAGCGPHDFRTRQFSGRYGLRVGSAHTTDLRRLGVAPAQWPQVIMINRSENQDGCKGATVELELRGTAVGVAS